MESQTFSFLDRNRRILDAMVNGHRRLPEPPIAENPTTKPAVGFPLGTALVLVIVLGITTMLSCYYHWEKIRNRASRLTGNRSGTRPIVSLQEGLATRRQGPLTTPMPSKKARFSQEDLSLSVVMPGDNVPKYIAWPSPHDPT
ncbi:hypothetical protein O6H91_21G015800 [Diphasiastrum complanatum]|uniref:Uncharacterized protein n=1 Tax=Diphasiastrum complanatum TaxID=34168 RepID=A0ACC2AIB0_DIPCM|nr:hypothetical protein O6H91_Y117100 [Diphasiastrum complanatum]KAJ7517253.1 hypothetical protein O6H91_21G015800 [Diphasiastrum complanatum]